MSWLGALTGFLGGGGGGQGAGAPPPSGSSTTVHNHIQFTNAASANQGSVSVDVGQKQGGAQAASDLKNSNQAEAKNKNDNKAEAASKAAAAAAADSSSSSGPAAAPAPKKRGGGAGAAPGGPSAPPSAASSGPAPAAAAGSGSAPGVAEAQLDLVGRAMEKLIERIALLEHMAAPVGSIVAWHKSAHNGAHIPDGWIECNGQFKVVGNRTYTTPNLNSGGSGGAGLFIRGGAVSGVQQASALGKHKHNIAAARCSVTDAGGAVMERSQMFFAPPGAVDIHRVSFNGGPNGKQADMGVSIPAHSSDDTGGDETRPENISMVWIMRVF